MHLQKLSNFWGAYHFMVDFFDSLRYPFTDVWFLAWDKLYRFLPLVRVFSLHFTSRIEGYRDFVLPYLEARSLSYFSIIFLNVTPIRIMKFHRKNRTVIGHEEECTYRISITV